MNREANCCNRLSLVDTHMTQKCANPLSFVARFWVQKMDPVWGPLNKNHTQAESQKRTRFGSTFESPNTSESLPKNKHLQRRFGLLCVRQPMSRYGFVGNVVIIGTTCC